MIELRERKLPDSSARQEQIERLLIGGWNVWHRSLFPYINLVNPLAVSEALYDPHRTSRSNVVELPNNGWATAESTYKSVKKRVEAYGRPMRMIGHSLGGVIVGRLAVEHPDLISGRAVAVAAPLGKVNSLLGFHEMYLQPHLDKISGNITPDTPLTLVAAAGDKWVPISTALGKDLSGADCLEQVIIPGGHKDVINDPSLLKIGNVVPKPLLAA